jgi:hypothetical protein
MNVGFQEKHPERNCLAIGCIHSVSLTLLNVLRKSKNFWPGVQKEFIEKERDRPAGFRVTVDYKTK